MTPTWHELKTWPEPFHEIVNGRKTHEVRRFDRDFSVGDILLLREWTPSIETTVDGDGYTGRRVPVRVTHITAPGTWGLPADLGVLSIQRLSTWQCSGCRWAFAGWYQHFCPVCKKEAYWSGSCNLKAKFFVDGEVR